MPIAKKVIIETKTLKPVPTDGFQAGLFPFYRGNHPMGNLKEDSLFYYLENTAEPYLFTKKVVNKKVTSGIEKHLVLGTESSIDWIDRLFSNEDRFEAITLQCECSIVDIKVYIQEIMRFLKEIALKNTKPLFIELNPHLSIENYLIVQRVLRLLWADCIDSLSEKLPLQFTQVVSEKMSESEVIQQICKTEWGENSTYRLMDSFSKKGIKNLQCIRVFLLKECMIHPTIDPLGGSLLVDKKVVELYKTIR